MTDFLILSLVASIVLTVLLNAAPLIFPKSSQKLERKVQQKINETIEQQDQGNQPRIRVFFPWKTMLAISIGLTVLVNLIGWFSRSGS